MAEAPAPTPTPTPAPAPTPTPTPTPAPAWHGLTEPDAIAYVDNKAWKAPADIIKSYQSAEKLIGRDPSTLIAMPRTDDAEGMRALFSKLGMPESPDKYELFKPDGVQVDEGYQKWSKETFHKLGFTAAQAKQLTQAHHEYITQQMQKDADDYKVNVEADKQALLAEWRGGHERMMNRAQTAAKALGFTPEVVDAIERSLGYAATMKLFAGIGGKMSEDGFVSSGDKVTNFGDAMTPAEATQAWEAMKLDPQAMAALKDVNHPGNKAAAEKQRKLFQLMHPEQR